MRNKFEQEAAFLRAVEDRNDPQNIRKPLSREELQVLPQTIPGVPAEFLSWLREIGPGCYRECQVEIFGNPRWFHEIANFSKWTDHTAEFVEFGQSNPDLLVIGHDFAGNLYALDMSRKGWPVEIDHETLDLWDHEGADLRSFFRDLILMDEDGYDLREA